MPEIDDSTPFQQRERNKRTKEKLGQERQGPSEPVNGEPQGTPIR